MHTCTHRDWHMNSLSPVCTHAQRHTCAHIRVWSQARHGQLPTDTYPSSPSQNRVTHSIQTMHPELKGTRNTRHRHTVSSPPPTRVPPYRGSPLPDSSSPSFSLPSPASTSPSTGFPGHLSTECPQILPEPLMSSRGSHFPL